MVHVIIRNTESIFIVLLQVCHKKLFGHLEMMLYWETQLQEMQLMILHLQKYATSLTVGNKIDSQELTDIQLITSEIYGAECCSYFTGNGFQKIVFTKRSN